MTTYEKIVKGATKVKVAAPKAKYIEPILLATSTHHGMEHDNFHTVMRTLQARLQDSAWSVVFKSLIVIHIMVREGDKDFTLRYIGEQMPNLLSLNQASVSRSTGVTNDVRLILKYAKYLQTRVKQFDATGIDYVRDERSNNSTSQNGGRLRHLTVEKGLLRESESVQKQIDALLRNSFMENDVNNDVVLTAFRLLVNDLLALFQELNEGVINLLEHYFEMSKVDAERALRIYKKFVDQTKYVIDYLRVAKHLEHLTKLHVPTIKHAPTALTSSLEEYLDDPNFDANRRQYLIEKQIKNTDAPAKSEPTTSTNPWDQKQQQYLAQQHQQQQQQLAQQSAQQQSAQQQLAQQQLQNQLFTGMAEQPQQVFAMPQVAQVQAQLQQAEQAINPSFTGAGFGGYGAQIQPQHTQNNPFASQIAPQTTQQFVQQQQQPPQQTGFSQFQQPAQTAQQPAQFQQQFQQQPTQQFQQPTQQPTQQFQQPQFQAQPLAQQHTAPLGVQRTNTNPFSSMTNGSLNNQGTGNPFANSRFASGSTTTALTFNNSQPKVQSHSTGSNPFKVSDTTSKLFENASQAQNNQSPLRPQATAGGLENLPTIPVFPETQQEQQRQQLLNNNNLLQQMTANKFQQLQAQSTQQWSQQGQPVQQQQQPQQQWPIQQQPTQQWPAQPTQQWPTQQPTQQSAQPTQQWPIQQQPTQQWQQPAPQPVYANNTYNGGSLI